MKRSFRTAVLLGLGAGAALAISQIGEAQEAKEKMKSVSAQHSPVDVLKMAAEGNLHVYVNLKAGKEYSARVKEVSSHAAVLKNPMDREFYEVYIPMDAIASVEIKVRDR